MTIRIFSIDIENFRGIVHGNIKFGEINFLIGNNGTGKSAMLASIARLISALRGEDRIFLDADFYFDTELDTRQIKIIYDFEISLEKDTPQRLSLTLTGVRQNSGPNRSHLNDQKPAKIKIELKDKNGNNLNKLLERLKDSESLGFRVIRHNLLASRVSPISLKTNPKQKHAATSMHEDQVCFDSLRARFLQLLKKSHFAETINQDHPDLITNTIGFANEFIEENRFKSIAIGYSEKIVVQKSDGAWEPWEGLSVGEQLAFNLAMAIEFEKFKPSQIIAFEEPESNLHPSLQLKFLEKVEKLIKGKQVFVATHSPYTFKNHINENNQIIISKKQSGNIIFENIDAKFSILTKPSWGEINYYAYNLLTAEFHNELYGHIEEHAGRVDNFLISEKIIKESDKIIWKDASNNPPTERSVSLMTYIRHFIHHPENKLNNEYSEEDLLFSIEKMIAAVKKLP